MKFIDINFDHQHIWHPYTSMLNPIPVYPIIKGFGVELELNNGKKLIDGMSSWWAAIHGYNHPFLNKIAKKQLDKISHVMFGGITHKPAIDLCKKLINITPKKIECVFLADSGSIAIEVALKMAIQYWKSRGESRNRFLTLKNAYHGDTFLAVSVSDPKNSMHKIYGKILPNNIFVDSPKCGFHENWKKNDTVSFEKKIEKYKKEIAAVILEPIVQGAGGMRIYHPNYLKKVREICDYYNILLILDEIATGFGRTGKLFAYEHSSIVPDILCLGKALTAGYITLSSVLTTREIANTISQYETKCFMYGPTFMGNPLACSIANANLKLLKSNQWKVLVKNIETQLIKELYSLKDNRCVSDVRVLGAIGVVEMKKKINLIKSQEYFVKKGVWIRPFGKLIYLMPPYIIKKKQLKKLTQSIKNFIKK